MSQPDEGGFDLVIEIAEALLAAAASATVVPPTRQTFDNSTAKGSVSPAVTVTSVAVASPNLLTLTLDLSGTDVTVSRLTLAGFPFTVPDGSSGTANLQHIPLHGTVNMSGVLTISGINLVADFTGLPTAQSILIDPAIDSSILTSPLGKFLLASARMFGFSDAQASAMIVAPLHDQLAGALRAAVTAGGPITIVPAPAVPPPSTPVSVAQFQVTSHAIRMLYTLGGTPGTPSLITRSNLPRGAVSGIPGDKAALIVANACLLRDFMRPTIATALGLSASGFIPTHPFFWFGSAPLPIPPGVPMIASVALKSLLAGIDGTNLRLLAHVDTVGSGSAFTISTSLDITLAVTPTPGSLSLTVAIPPGTTPAVTSDTSIAAWVYAAAFFTGGVEMALVVAAIDAFSGSIADGPIAAGIAASAPTMTVPLALPAGAPPVFIRNLSLGQSDAATRTFTIFSIITIADPFPSNDLIVNLS